MYRTIYIVTFLLAMAIPSFAPAKDKTIVDTHGALSVNGNRIVDMNGDVVSLAGVSLFWSNEEWGGERFYSKNTVSYLANDWGASIVRAAFGADEPGGYFEFPEENMKRLDTVVKAAIDEGIYVIIDWHSHHAEDFREEAVAFFTKVANKYGAFPNVIYEIYNEPLKTATWAGDVKPYAESVIEAIREIDADNLIIVGSPTWSQDVDVASKKPILGYENIAYTLHFYAGTHKQELRDKAQVALDNGIALMVTEWGTVEASGDGAVDHKSVAEWLVFLRENDLSHCNWAFNDKLEGASILIPLSDETVESWPNSSLTESGILVKEIVTEWSN